MIFRLIFLTLGFAIGSWIAGGEYRDVFLLFMGAVGMAVTVKLL